MSPSSTETTEEQWKCGHGDAATAAIWDVNLAHELTAQLQALVLPLLPPDDDRSELARRLFKETRMCFASALSRLQAAAAAGGGARCGSSVDGSADRADRKSSSACYSGEKRKSSGRGFDDEETPESHKRRRKNSHCSVVTTVPYEDGYQWRKYGQKNISGDKYPRSYFRCAYSKEQEGCPATKTVQQDDDDDSYPPKFHVNYNMEHTCQQSNSVGAHLPTVGAAECSIHGADASADNSSSESRRSIKPDTLVLHQPCDHTSSPSVAAVSATPSEGADDVPAIAEANPVTAVEKSTTAAAAAYDLDMPWAQILDSIEASSQIM